MIKAICISCGTRKSAPWKKCSHCGLDPSTDEMALVKSVYLSVGRFEDPDQQRRYSEELEHLGTSLRDGGVVEYDGGELHRLRKQKKALDGVPMSSVWGAVFRLFLPGIATVVLLLVVFLERCSGS